MSDDRRVIAPVSTPPGEPVLDEVAAPPPPVESNSDVTRGRPGGDANSARRVRARMTLRIPDDEIARPNPPEPDRAEIKGTRIISVGPPPMDDEDLRDDGPTAPPPPPPPHLQGHEDSWTPYQPTVADDAVAASPRGRGSDAHVPISEEIPVVDSSPQIDAAPTARMLPAAPPSYPPVPGRPLEPVPPPRAPMMALMPEAEGEEVRFEDEDAPPAGRASEPGDAPEISAEDMVIVEASTKKVSAAPAAAPARAKPRSVPPPPSVQSNPPPSARAPLPLAVPPTPPSGPSVTAAAAAAVTSPSAPKGDAGPRQSTPLAVLAPPPLTEANAPRKRARPWWEELFNDDFIRASAKITDAQIRGEATFIEESLRVAQGGMLLDLACGTGLHAIELTKRGYHVVGFDLSLAMLARAADEAHDRATKINFLQGDMRDMVFEEQFDGVYCWGTSFGYFEEEKNAQVISKVHKALKPGGGFLLDVVNRDFIMRQSPSLAWFEGEGCICMDEMQIDWITSRMKVKRTMMMDDGRTKEIEYSIRVYALHELGRILHDCGFKVTDVSGRTATPGVFFGCDSPRALILAEKR